MSHGLQRIKVQGFGSLRDITLEPGRLTVLIGANGSGKSNLLRALRLVSFMRAQSLQRFVRDAGGASGILFYGPERSRSMNIELDFYQESARNWYQAQLGWSGDDQLVFINESVGYQSEEMPEMHVLSLGGRHWESALSKAKYGSKTAKTVNYWLSQLSHFHFHDTSTASALRSYARGADNRYLRSDGSNLPAYLARLEQSEEESHQLAFRRINQLVNRIAPSIKRLCPTAMRDADQSVCLDWIDDQNRRFGVHQLSDGTLRAILLITAFAQPPERLPRVISIDEPELGLHPAALTLLANLARSVSSHTQVLFATQSVVFLDHFDANEVVLMERQQGESVVRRLNTKQLEDWLDNYSLSEAAEQSVEGPHP